MSGTQVDFYLLSDSGSGARLRTACRLAEKAYDQGLRVLVRAPDAAESAELDELMWTFSDRSFIPHCIWPQDRAVAGRTPVLIANGSGPDTHRDVLVNLGSDPPDGYTDYGRVLEIVGADEESRRQARGRWRTYRDGGARLESHTL